MGCFDRHLATRYLLTVGLLQLALVIVISVSLLVEDVEIFSASERATATTMLALLGLRALIYGYQLLPIAAFLGVLVWGALLAQRGELIAAYVGGYHPARLAAPILAGALLLAGLTFATGEWLVPPAANRLVQIRSLELYGVDPLERLLSKRVTWYRDGDLLLNLPAVDLERQELHEPQVFVLGPGGLVRGWWRARLLARPAGGWELRDGVYWDLSAGGAPLPRPFAAQALPLAVELQDLLDLSSKPEQLSAAELARVIERRRKLGHLTRLHTQQLHQRFVYPVSLLVLVLLSLPLALVPERRRGLTGALGSGSAVAALAYAIDYLFRSLVAAGAIAPALGAWLPALVTALAGVGLFVAVKRVLQLTY